MGDQGADQVDWSVALSGRREGVGWRVCSEGRARGIRQERVWAERDGAAKDETEDLGLSRWENGDALGSRAAPPRRSLSSCICSKTVRLRWFFAGCCMRIRIVAQVPARGLPKTPWGPGTSKGRSGRVAGGGLGSSRCGTCRHVRSDPSVPWEGHAAGGGRAPWKNRRVWGRTGWTGTQASCPCDLGQVS